MIKDPRTVVTATKASTFEITGPNAEACRSSLQTWFDRLPVPLKQALSANRLCELGVKLRIESAPPRHSGFGSGTQLALSTVMAVTQLLELPSPGPSELAASVGRGKRSGIGSHGFFCGGFLVDRGVTSVGSLAPLDFQIDFPESWSIVTVLLENVAGLSGRMEVNAFQALPPTPVAQRNELIEIVRSKMIPGIIQMEYDAFAEGVFRLGRGSGMMFSKVQNGAYNGPAVETLVHQIRDFGVGAVGQSSWGPCVFAITSNDKQAQQLAAYLETAYSGSCDIRITQADNQGASTINPKMQSVFQP